MSVERLRSPELRVAIGQRYGRLVVTGLIKDAKNPKAICRCDCGAEVTPQRGALLNGRAKSCGCLRRELLKAHVASITRPEAIRRAARNRSNKQWAEKNRGRVREINRLASKRFHKKHPERTREGCRNRRAKLAGLIGSVSKNIEAVLFRLQKGRCACCKTRLKSGAVHLDHVIAISRGGLHDDSNLQLLCKFCNLSKGTKSQTSFMQSRGLLL